MIGRQMTAILVAATLSGVAAGQCISGEKAPVESRIRRLLNPNGQGIPNAQITVLDTGTKVLFRTRSDSHGRFSIPHLKNHEARVEVEAAGYIRHHYTLLPSGNSRKVQPLSLVPASQCSDMKIVEDDSAP
jgi:hypothetical protein